MTPPRARWLSIIIGVGLIVGASMIPVVLVVSGVFDGAGEATASAANTVALSAIPGTVIAALAGLAVSGLACIALLAIARGTRRA